MKRILVLFLTMAGGINAVMAQNHQQTPNMPLPQQVPAEKVEPQGIQPEEPSSTGSTLSDKLEKSDGVIRPPETGGPDIRVPAPVPDPGTTPVIPPPGSPGGNPYVEPK